ncbi:unnamed protein product [Caenorhabditis sp. 36 PRJEB53466]|nr:unnamed protein product [Caenorhabditis sp. 36 PRJEB53466]
MNAYANNMTLLNLRDSVSRIVDNFGFTDIDNTAHAKLVSIVAAMMHSMSHTCRILIENSGRSASSLNPIDIKHMFRMHHIDVEAMVVYVNHVNPYPPSKIEIHGEMQSAQKVNKEKKTVKSVCTKASKKRCGRSPIYKLPNFDDMDDVQLGFASLDPAIPPPVFLPPPPPPPPLPPVYSPDAHFEIPIFDPEIPPPPVSQLPAPNYTTPDIPSIIPEPEKISCTNVVLDVFLPDEPKEVSKSFKVPKIENPYILPKTPSNPTLSAPRMTKKRKMLSKYERRLRDEQTAIEEQRKERKLEKKRQESEVARRSAEREKEKLPSLVFKFKPEVIEERRRNELCYEHGEQQSSAMIEDDNQKLGSKQEIEEAMPPKDGLPAMPLPKMHIRYKRVKKGILIKKITHTNFIWCNGKWQERRAKQKFPKGVLSDPPATPQRRRLERSKPIPKLRIIRKDDGTYKTKQRKSR